MQRCDITELVVEECAHCRASDSKRSGRAEKKQRHARGSRQTKVGSLGRRTDGRYLVAARVESKCEACQLPVVVGDVVVRDDFGQWVHDGCCLESDTTAPGNGLPSRAPSQAPSGLSQVRDARNGRRRSASAQRVADKAAHLGAVEVYTDGACSGNPGPGGWAWVVGDGRQASGSDARTTNQRMEIRAALEAVRALPGPLIVVSDSTYVVNCFREGWWRGWRRRSWLNSAKRPVANRDLWEPLVDLVEARGEITFRWAKGHSGNRLNDLVDRLAVAAALNQS